MNRLSLSALLLLALVLLLGTSNVAHAAESYDNCAGFINSLPAVITTQGTWCLKKDLATSMTSGKAITISTNNVTIDCNDFKLGGLAAGTATQAIGIYAQLRSNVTVRRCNVRGFVYGLYFPAVDRSTVEDNRFANNTQWGILVFGDGSVVRRNQVLDTGGSASQVAGIQATNADVIDNTVSGVMGTGYVYGINANSRANNYGSISVRGNRVRGLSSNDPSHIAGIRVGTDDPSGPNLYNHVVLSSNDVAGSAAIGSIGIDCDSTTSGIRNNVINGFATGVDTCTDYGGNVIVP